MVGPLVDLATVSFDFMKNQCKKMINMDIIKCQPLCDYYDEMKDISREFYPLGTIQSFSNDPIIEPKHYERLNTQLRIILSRIQLRGHKDKYLFRKQQNILRHTNIFDSLIDILNTYCNYIDNNKFFDDDVQGDLTFTYTITILYYFCYNNTKNRRILLEHLKQPFYDNKVFRTADLFQEINGFEHVSMEDFQVFTQVAVRNACFSFGKPECANGLRYLQLMMFDSHGMPKLDIQSVLSRQLIELFAGSIDYKMEKWPNDFDMLIKLLAMTAFGNQSVAIQCQKLLRIPKILDFLGWASNPRIATVNGLFHYFTYVYIFEQKMEELPDDTQICKVLDKFLPYVKLVHANLDALPKLAETG